MNKIMQSSEGKCKRIRIIETKFVKEGRVNKNVIDMYMRSENIPILWKFFFVEIANEGSNQNNRPKFFQQCRERYFSILNDTILCYINGDSI